jgi:DNA-binding NarL/FixJ family response regulator
MRPTKVLVMSESAIVRGRIRALLGRLADVWIVGETSSMRDLSRLLMARTPHLLLLGPLTRPAAEDIGPGPPSVMLIVADEHTPGMPHVPAVGSLGCVNLDLSHDAFVRWVRRIARGDRLPKPGVRDHVRATSVRRAAAPDALVGTRRMDVLRLIAEGRTNQEIAKRFGYTSSTIRDCARAVLPDLLAGSLLTVRGTPALPPR